ncbi:carbohydrate esterase family 3 protein [Apiospora phragmitis]|uniref:Carbohydrate esterase family 3 protein n=1 Tax=Apiospora phragmitis TaxID=2905665 RepID=A0ABR1VDQ3_9PEZI
MRLTYSIFYLSCHTALFLSLLDSQDVTASPSHYIPGQTHSGGTEAHPIAGGIPLRVMFIGASISRGEESTHNVGYRQQLRDWMAAQGNPVNCVGTQRFGYHVNDDGNGGLGLGDNNGTAFRDDNKAGVDTTVVMSTLATTPNKEKERCFFSANAQIRQAALDLQREGLPVVLAEMHYDQGLPGRPRESDIGPDDIHPPDDGYLMMGDIFKDTIREADFEGFIKRAVDNGIPDDGNAERLDEEVAAAQAQAQAPAPAEEAKSPLPHRRA